MINQALNLGFATKLEICFAKFRGKFDRNVSRNFVIFRRFRNFGSNKNINKWLSICIDKIKIMADLFGALQTPTYVEYVHCISYSYFGPIIEGRLQAVVLWYRYLLFIQIEKGFDRLLYP